MKNGTNRQETRIATIRCNVAEYRISDNREFCTY